MQRIALVMMAVGLAACGAGSASTPSAMASASPPRSSAAGSSPGCAADALNGTYARRIDPSNAVSADMAGDWTLSIEGCRFEISQDGVVQGGGRIDLVDGKAESGRVALSEDLCRNEFSGTGFYEVTLRDGQLAVSESIMGTDQCVGRADAFVTPPLWERQ